MIWHTLVIVGLQVLGCIVVWTLVFYERRRTRQLRAAQIEAFDAMLARFGPLDASRIKTGTITTSKIHTGTIKTKWVLPIPPDSVPDTIHLDPEGGRDRREV